MEISSFLGAIVAVIAMWGSLWHKIGKMEGHLKEHNGILDRIEKQIERIITQGGKGNGS